MEQPNYYTNIPAFVRYDEALLKKPKAILLYGEIVALSNQKGFCWANNAYFSDRLKVSGRMIKDYLDLLVRKGYVARKLIYKPGSKQVDKRILSIASRPGEVHFTRGEADFPSPGEADFPDNITSINTTSNNDDDQPVEDAFNLAQLAGINVNSGLNLPVFTDYINRLGNELVCYAIKRTNDVAQHPSWSYLKTVLKSLEDNHVKTVKQAEKLSKKYGQNRKSGKSSPRKTGKKPQYHFETRKAPEGMSRDEFFAKELAEIEAEDKAKENGDDN